jgi:hypothetical protein
MKTTPLLVLAIAIAFALVSWSIFGKETFKDIEYYGGNTTQVSRTIAKEDSSYEQSTNSMPPPPVNSPPITGRQTPFQVNQYTAYMS